MWEFSLKTSKNVRSTVLLQNISSGHLVTQGLKSRGQKRVKLLWKEYEEEDEKLLEIAAAAAIMTLGLC